MKQYIISMMKQGYLSIDSHFEHIEYRFDYDDNGQTVVEKYNAQTGDVDILSYEEFVETTNFDNFLILKFAA